MDCVFEDLEPGMEDWDMVNGFWIEDIEDQESGMEDWDMVNGLD
jgi:hypothetical protein